MVASFCELYPQHRTAVSASPVTVGDLDMSAIGPARVKTFASQESVEPFSLLPSWDSRRQHFWFSD